MTKQLLESKIELNRTEIYTRPEGPGAGQPVPDGYVERFTAQAARNPAAVAARFQGEELTYGELERRSNQFAHALHQVGTGPEVLVAVCMERSLDMLVALLAVWKTGGAYVPLDPQYPQERLAYMLGDSGAKVLITTRDLLPILPGSELHVFCLDDPDQRRAWLAGPTHSPGPSGKPDTLAYVIYTSGSTGKPKGVEITREALLNHNQAIARGYGLNPNDRVLQFASLSFDVSIEEIFPSWLSGSTVVLRNDEVASSVFGLLSFIEEEKLSVLNLPTAYWHELVEQLKPGQLPESVRLVVIGGEKASDEAFKKWKAIARPGLRLINGYGPTESTVTATMYEADSASETLLIGKPIANTLAVVLDENLQPVPPGGSGELFLGGKGLARGYRHRPQLTAQRFVELALASNTPTRRLYRTGDAVRLHPDGNLEFVGRTDQQVKIRGFRIELAEIETALLTHPAIRDTAVIAGENSRGRKRLVAYCVPRGGAGSAPSVSDLIHFLRTKLPAYMVPSSFVILDEFPLTPAGKIDRLNLPPPSEERPELDQDFVALEPGLEQQLAAIWKEVLQVDCVGAKDNFFELGGDSLLAFQVLSRIRDRLELDLQLTTFFEASTVSELAQVLGSSRQERRSGPLVNGRRYAAGTEVPVSFIQEQLWFLNQLYPESDAYHVPAALRLKGRLDIPALEQALHQVVARHETLRTTFQFDESLRPVIATRLEFKLPLTDLSQQPAPAAEAEFDHLLRTEAKRPFDLAKGPLLRAQLFRLSEAHHVLLLVMHHSISDGWSLGIFFKELETCYNALLRGAGPTPLPELPAQYADFARWQRQSMQGATLEQHLAYWRRQLAGAPGEIRFPGLRPHTGGIAARAGRCRTIIAGETLRSTSLLARSRRATPFMVLLSALAITLYKWTGQKDLVLGTVVAGRSRREFEHLVGCFMNFLALRINVAESPSGQELLAAVQKTVLEAQQHQDCPFEKVVAALNPKRQGDRNPLYNVAFLWQSFPSGQFRSPDLEVTPVEISPETPLLDLRFLAEPEDQDWALSCEYNAQLFDRQTIQAVLDATTRTLERLVTEPQTPLDSFTLSRTRSSWWQRWFGRGKEELASVA